MTEKERRTGKEQRSELDRRKLSNPNYNRPERRTGGDRRSIKNRRKSP